MTKMQNIPKLPTSKFTYIKENRTFVTEASDIHGFDPRRIYDDACDIGFYMVSDKTGKKILFVEEGPDYNDDNELICWNFSAHCINENPENLHDLVVRIYND